MAEWPERGATRDLEPCGKGLEQVTTYAVRLDRDQGGAWLARCIDVPGCHTYGRSLRQARSRIREALSLWVEDADTAELEFRYHFPAGWREAVDACRQTRARAIDAEKEALAIAAVVASELTQHQGLSMRDVAEMIGISHQRVQQIVVQHGMDHMNGAPNPGSRGRLERLTARLREGQGPNPIH